MSKQTEASPNCYCRPRDEKQDQTAVYDASQQEIGGNTEITF